MAAPFLRSEQCTCEDLGTCSFCEANSTVDDRERRQKLRCPLCKPNRGENAKRRSKRGAKKPRGKKHG